MSDTGSAYIYASIYKRLASKPTPQHRRWAKRFWRESFEYDFNGYDLCGAGAEASLVRLGLARRVRDESGERAIEFRSQDCKTWRDV